MVKQTFFVRTAKFLNYKSFKMSLITKADDNQVNKQSYSSFIFLFFKFAKNVAIRSQITCNFAEKNTVLLFLLKSSISFFSKFCRMSFQQCGVTVSVVKL